MADEIEDREWGGQKPYIDLTPVDLWGKQIPKILGSKPAVALKEHLAERAHQCCELCGAGPKTKGLMGQKAHKNFRVEMRFAYDDSHKRATLRRLIYVCHKCSQAIHLRQTEIESRNFSRERSPMIGALVRLRFFFWDTKTNEDIYKDLMVALALWETRVGYDFDYSVAISLSRALTGGI